MCCYFNEMNIIIVLLAARFVLGTDENQAGKGFEEECKLKLPYGYVQCSRETSPVEGKPIKSYRGIPYAKITNRFEDPIAVSSTSTPNVLYNGGDCPACFQANSSFYSYDLKDISEDCLFLNVFVPSDCGDEPLPVLFYIHGGSFEMGNGPKDPSNLLNAGVIVVTFNYRLGVFGFLSTGTCDCPGNAGLKDSLAALQWVNVNIAHFGGDPKNITVYGMSAGATIATLLQIHPLACDLFQKIIIESGTLLAPWSYIPLEKAIGSAMKLGSKVGCNLTDPSELCSCLKKVSAMALVRKVDELTTDAERMSFAFIPFAPTAENGSCRNTFMTQNPQNYISKGSVCRVSILIGLTQNEACVFKKELEAIRHILKALTPAAYKIGPKCLAETANSLCKEYISKEIVAHYAKNDSVLNDKNVQPLISTVNFLMPIIIYATLMTKLGCDIYLYEFAYVGPCSISALMGEKSTCHAEQYPYLFPNELSQWCNTLRPNGNDEIVRKNITTLYANFIKWGNPTPNNSNLTWPVWTAYEQAYLEININLIIRYKLGNSEMCFWKKLFDKCFSNTSNGQICCSTCSGEFSPVCIENGTN